MRIDGKKIPRSALEQIRIQSAKEMAAGASPTFIANRLCVSVRSVLRWQANYQAKGEEGLRATVSSGRPPKVSPAIQAKLRGMLKLNPVQLSFPFALWTRSMVAELLQREFGITLTLPAIGDLLERMGMTPQKPQFVAAERDPERVARWEEVDYPAIRAAAERDNALIFFGDESGIRSDHHSGTTWAPRGQTPKVEVTGQRFSMNMLSAVCTTGEMKFMITESRVASDTFIEFLARLMHGQERNVHLILDGARFHFSKAVKAAVAGYNGKLTLHCLPPYSPHLNPDEQVWSRVKQEVGRKSIFDRKSLREALEASLSFLSGQAALIKAMFRHKDCRHVYAADVA